MKSLIIDITVLFVVQKSRISKQLSILRFICLLAVVCIPMTSCSPRSSEERTQQSPEEEARPIAEKKAREDALARFNKLFLQAGNDWFTLDNSHWINQDNSDTFQGKLLIQAKEVIAECIPASVSHADNLNGIEWAGDIVIWARAWRRGMVHQASEVDKGWDPWQDGRAEWPLLRYRYIMRNTHLECIRVVDCPLAISLGIENEPSIKFECKKPAKESIPPL